MPPLSYPRSPTRQAAGLNVLKTFTWALGDGKAFFLGIEFVSVTVWQNCRVEKPGHLVKRQLSFLLSPASHNTKKATWKLNISANYQVLMYSSEKRKRTFGHHNYYKLLLYTVIHRNTAASTHICTTYVHRGKKKGGGCAGTSITNCHTNKTNIWKCPEMRMQK